MKTAFVVTTISKPTTGMRYLAAGAKDSGADFYVIGDAKTPSFCLGGCSYYSLQDQLDLGLHTAQVGPINSYTRKNVGYLLAQRNRADVIIETDDDNIPRPEFWEKPTQYIEGAWVYTLGWTNVYKHFTHERIWPRGLPLDEIDNDSSNHPCYGVADCPIQQGLADEDPDVDAIYRLTHPGAVYFKLGMRIALDSFVWSPFNSQNTTWFRGAFPLMYLPSTCSFRMTDIWRSLVAQRILWTNNQKVLFHSPTVVQKRNKHNLMDDFQQEIPGYLNNRMIAEVLERQSLRSGFDEIANNMQICYEALVSRDLLEEKELALLEYWLMDVKELK
jgi:hypothetical protein